MRVAGGTIDLGSLLGMSADEDEAPQNMPLPEAQIEMLNEFHSQYKKKRFVPGDLITPMASSNSRHAGQPHIVLETNYDCEPNFVGNEVSTSQYGKRLDVRVLCYTEGHYSPFWCESWQFEEYDLVRHGKQNTSDSTDE